MVWGGGVIDIWNNTSLAFQPSSDPISVTNSTNKQLFVLWVAWSSDNTTLPATELNTDRQKTQLWDTDRYCTGDDIITSITPTIHYHYAANSLQQPISTAVSGGNKTRWVWKVSQSARLEHRTVTEWVGNRDGCGVRRGTTACAVSMYRYRQNGETLESLLFYKTLTTCNWLLNICFAMEYSLTLSDVLEKTCHSIVIY